MALDATVGGASADSFVSVVDADTYHGARLHNTDWTSATEANKEKALKWATRILDNLEWLGARESDTQALRWPRYGVPDREGSLIDDDEIPTWLKNATAELAFLLIIEDRTVEKGTEGFKRIKVGELELEIDSFDRAEEIADAVWEMIRWYLESRNRLSRG